MFHASIQVIKGDDVSFFIADSNNTIIYNMEKKNSGYHQIQNSTTKGDYQICIDNQYSLVTNKIVYLYIFTFHADKMMEQIKVINRKKVRRNQINMMKVK